MKKNLTSSLLLMFGTFFLLGAFAYGLLITSDIPVLYAVDEAITLQVLLFISTLLTICGSIINSQNAIRYTVLAALTLFMLLNIYLLEIDAEYFNASYAQIAIAFVLHPFLIILVNIFVQFKKNN
ncbi:hypothetical protein ACFTQ7_10245 [Lysinibacillus sp. NPDC056959]|uniref:hypothetical protein n=1 Tax=Lysinibacillus sp. NPDC056959 TaxID=3345981 RepID=UPI00362B9E69